MSDYVSTIDKNLDAILKAAGSGLQHYSMEKTLTDMREAMRSIMVSCYLDGQRDSDEFWRLKQK